MFPVHTYSYDQNVMIQLWTKLNNILSEVFRATLTFLKYKVAFTPMIEFFLALPKVVS